MPERVEQWWSRRQWSKGTSVPYEIGRFRADWERYPVLVRQYHPDLNHGITLSQVPPAADVYLVWQCDSGHRFVATPEEQRQRPGTSRRRSTWCPDCAALAVRRRAPTAAGAPESRGGWGMGLPARTGPSRGALSEAPHGDRYEPSERLEDQGTEGDESREGDEHRDPQQSVHGEVIGGAPGAAQTPSEPFRS